MNVPVHHTLLQVIRDHLNLTEVKYGCGRGECGACTVLVDDGKGKRKPILACIALAATMDGKSITTAAGLAKNGELHPVQKAFVDESAIQCGFCTPGMVLKAVSILEKNPKPTEEEIRPVWKAISAAAPDMRKSSKLFRWPVKKWPPASDRKGGTPWQNP